MTVVRIPVDCYISADFAALELARLWPRVWQFACSIDDVAHPGDVYEHTIGPYSLIIVHGEDGELRAFQNVCQHRGAELCTGNQHGVTELRCPFHRWTWNLDGTLSEIPSRKEFGIRNEELGLIPARVDTWGPLVFVNLDPDAEPLYEFLDPVPADALWADIDRFACNAAVAIHVDCNWKTLIEGFSETYHVQGIHREMLPMCDDVRGPQTTWQRHGKLQQSYGLASPRLHERPNDQQIWEAFVEVMGARAGADTIEAAGIVPNHGTTLELRASIAQRIREHGAAKGIDYERFSDAEMIDMHQYNIFPNITVLVFADMVNVVRARPGADPDHSYIDMWNFAPIPTVAGGGSVATTVATDTTTRVAPLHVELQAADGDLMGLILGQDVKNFGRSQRGLHQPGLAHLNVSETEECRIVSLHRNLAEYLET